MTENNVFIIDDDESVRMSLTALLTAKGFSSRSYESAELFLESGDQNLQGCILADVRMAGMSGFQLHAELRRQGIKTPVVVITGFTEAVEGEIDESVDDGIRLLEKTCGSAELIRVVTESLSTS